jgi:hypothetical protein
MPLLNIATGDGVGYDDAGVGGAMDEGVGAIDVTAMDWRFANDAKHLVSKATTKLVKLVLGDDKPFVINWIIIDYLTIMHIMDECFK